MPGRQERVAEAIRRAVAETVLYRMRDPRLANTTITGAKVSRDLREARVSVSVLGERSELLAAVECLTGAQGFLRTQIAPVLGLRHVPELVFIADDSAATAARLEKLFREEGDEFGEEEAPDPELEADDE